jgi:hypothetical protein
MEKLAQREQDSWVIWLARSREPRQSRSGSPRFGQSMSCSMTHVLPGGFCKTCGCSRTVRWCGTRRLILRLCACFNYFYSSDWRSCAPRMCPPSRGSARLAGIWRDLPTRLHGNYSVGAHACTSTDSDDARCGSASESGQLESRGQAQSRSSTNGFRVQR